MALSNLASIATALGQLPQALAYRERAEPIRRRQNDESVLPYDLANRAELLIRLGRSEDASRVLDELDAGIRAGIDAYVGRARQAAFFRALAAVVALRPQEAVRHLQAVQPSDDSDTESVLAPMLLHYSQARLGHRSEPGRGAASAGGAIVPSGLAGERQYWRAATMLQLRDATAAAAEAERGLQLVGETPNDELRWRLAAIGALALRDLGESDRARDMSGRAWQALGRLRSGWPTGIEAYEKRSDLAELKARLGPS